MPQATGQMLTPSELSTFCAQVAMILRSGIPVAEGISVMYEDAEHAQGKEILKELLDHVEVGEPLFMALEACGRFPKYMRDMVEIGEQSGKLDEVLDSLVAYYEREENISSSIRSAVTYPLVMIVMMILVIGVLIVKVLPIFSQVFAQLGSEMTGFSRAVMDFGSALGSYSAVIVGVLAVLAVAFLMVRGTKTGRAALSRFQATFILTRRLSAKIASGRFASAMAMMLSSGLDTDKALDMVERLVDNPVIHEKITACRKLVEEGGSFSEALAKTEIFTGVYARMVSIGFKTGAADTVMGKLANQYEREVDAQIGGMISVLEPTLVAVLSVIVGMILLSVMLPLMGIMSSIG